VRKGRLVDDADAEQATTVCASHSCGRNCSNPQTCPFTMKLPRTISLIQLESD
jgi:hypothetical protein